MRVISGSAKGRRLRATRAPEMRPTTDIARRVIFDILGDTVSGARVLDLFAGAGTLGIESLSRGAQHATFVEQDREACSIILSNLETTALRSNATIVRADVVRALAKPPAEPFDLVFLDPPYGRGLAFVSRVLGRLAEAPWLRPGGTVVVEAEVGPIEWPPSFRETRTRRFGRTQVGIAIRHGERTNSDISGDF
jgi:16S rRNA (guanine966-N2)-methyltransferase